MILRSSGNLRLHGNGGKARRQRRWQIAARRRDCSGKGLGFPLHGDGDQQGSNSGSPRHQGQTLAALQLLSLAGQQGDGKQQGVAAAAMLHEGGETAMISNSVGPRNAGGWVAVLGNLLIFSSWVAKAPTRLQTVLPGRQQHFKAARRQDDFNNSTWFTKLHVWPVVGGSGVSPWQQWQNVTTGKNPLFISNFSITRTTYL